MELGISPIITSGMIMQLLAGAKIIDYDPVSGRCCCGDGGACFDAGMLANAARDGEPCTRILAFHPRRHPLPTAPSCAPPTHATSYHRRE